MPLQVPAPKTFYVGKQRQTGTGIERLDTATELYPKVAVVDMIHNSRRAVTRTITGG
jgi:hypothetical protein